MSSPLVSRGSSGVPAEDGPPSSRRFGALPVPRLAGGPTREPPGGHTRVEGECREPSLLVRRGTRRRRESGLRAAFGPGSPGWPALRLHRCACGFARPAAGSDSRGSLRQSPQATTGEDEEKERGRTSGCGEGEARRPFGQCQQRWERPRCGRRVAAPAVTEAAGRSKLESEGQPDVRGAYRPLARPISDPLSACAQDVTRTRRATTSALAVRARCVPSTESPSAARAHL